MMILLPIAQICSFVSPVESAWIGEASDHVKVLGVARDKSRVDSV